MAYVSVPKDLSRIKTKVALNLTARQMICFSIAAAVGIPVYLLTKKYISVDAAALIMVIVMLPFFFLALYEKDGFPAEKIIYQIIRHKFLLPGVRPYKTENLYDQIQNVKKEITHIESNKINDKKRSKQKHKNSKKSIS